MRSLNCSKIKITLLRGFAGKNENQRRIFISLGLKKIGSSKILPNTNCVLGQVNKVIQFIKVDPVETN